MAENPTPPGISLAEELNQDCHCISVNKDALRSSLQAHLSDQGLSEQLLSKHSHLFSSSPVFLWQQHIDKMQALINAVEKVVGNNKKYREAVLSAAPAIARQDPGPKGVFFGYDFHLAENGPQLIEINTNAGGVLLNLYLAAAQRACCEDVEAFFGVSTSFEALENQLIAMFKAEYRLHNSGKISGKASGKISGKASGKEEKSFAASLSLTMILNRNSCIPSFCCSNHSSRDTVSGQLSQTQRSYGLKTDSYLQAIRRPPVKKLIWFTTG